MQLACQADAERGQRQQLYGTSGPRHWVTPALAQGGIPAKSRRGGQQPQGAVEPTRAGRRFLQGKSVAYTVSSTRSHAHFQVAAFARHHPQTAQDGWPELEKRGSGSSPSRKLADGLEVRLAPLDLLCHRVHVPEPPLEGAAREDGGPAGGMVGGIDDLLGLVDGIGRRQTDQHALVEGNGAGAPDGSPDLVA